MLRFSRECWNPEEATHVHVVIQKHAVFLPLDAVGVSRIGAQKKKCLHTAVSGTHTPCHRTQPSPSPSCRPSCLALKTFKAQRNTCFPFFLVRHPGSVVAASFWQHPRPVQERGIGSRGQQRCLPPGSFPGGEGTPLGTPLRDVAPDGLHRGPRGQGSPPRPALQPLLPW